jgi:hypothetical protein
MRATFALLAVAALAGCGSEAAQIRPVGDRSLGAALDSARHPRSEGDEMSERTNLTDEEIRTDVVQEIKQETADADMDDTDTDTDDTDTDDTDSDTDDTDA